MDWAKAHAHELDTKKLTCISASLQTAGRGRLKRTWISKEGNLQFSLVFFLKKDDVRLPNMAQIAAFSIVRVLKQYGIRASIKWPNDLQYDQKKFAGVLVETSPVQDLLEVIVGIGIDVNAPVKVSQETISLSEITNTPWPLDKLLEAIINSFLIELKRGFSLQHYESHLAYIGEQIAVDILGKHYEGMLAGLTKSGHLRLILSDGTEAEFASGDIHRLRPKGPKGQSPNGR